MDLVRGLSAATTGDRGSKRHFISEGLEFPTPLGGKETDIAQCCCESALIVSQKANSSLSWDKSDHPPRWL